MYKRTFDIIVSAVMIVILAPVMAIVAVMVRSRLGKPVLFLHTRPGKDGRPFRLVKFRSMRNVDDMIRAGKAIDETSRLTPFSEFLRNSSLDELPSLLNVIKGDMSLVGPRPLEMKYLPLYNAEQRRRHDVRPGVTGWAQVNGRSAISWEDKFRLDVWYVDNRSFWLDLRILFLTARKVAGQSGATPQDAKIVASFEGSPSDKPDAVSENR